MTALTLNGQYSTIDISIYTLYIVDDSLYLCLGRASKFKKVNSRSEFSNIYQKFLNTKK